MLLATDLHADSILATQRERWLVIDPSPISATPPTDLLQHLLNCEARLAAHPSGLASRIAGLAGLDVDRVRQWLFARTAQECSTRVGRNDKP